MQKHLLSIFTRTPLHVGAGSSAGAIDQPIQRERPTGFPIIPASSLKGCFADYWPTPHRDAKGKSVRVTVRKEEQKTFIDQADNAAWLFGSDNPDASFAGALLFSEARLLAFPIRSARGSYAWVTCPLMLQRAARDGVFSSSLLADLQEPMDDDTTARAIFNPAGPLGLGSDKQQIVLEEYCFQAVGTFPENLARELSKLVSDDAFKSIVSRLVILSNGMMTHFATNACEIAQHVRICDETGTAEGTGLFNQENIPSETLFYSVLNATAGRGERFRSKTADEALFEFWNKINEVKVFQFGGDASTGLGFCTVEIATA